MRHSGWMDVLMERETERWKEIAPVRSIPDTLKLIKDAVILIERTKFAS